MNSFSLHKPENEMQLIAGQIWIQKVGEGEPIYDLLQCLQRCYVLRYQLRRQQIRQFLLIITKKNGERERETDRQTDKQPDKGRGGS